MSVSSVALMLLLVLRRLNRASTFEVLRGIVQFRMHEEKMWCFNQVFFFFGGVIHLTTLTAKVFALFGGSGWPIIRYDNGLQ